MTGLQVYKDFRFMAAAHAGYFTNVYAKLAAHLSKEKHLDAYTQSQLSRLETQLQNTPYQNADLYPIPVTFKATASGEGTIRVIVVDPTDNTSQAATVVRSVQIHVVLDDDDGV